MPDNSWKDGDNLSEMVTKYNQSVNQIESTVKEVEKVNSSLSESNNMLLKHSDKLSGLEENSMKKDLSNVNSSKLKEKLVVNNLTSIYVEAVLEGDQFNVSIPELTSVTDGTSLRVKFNKAVHTGAKVSINNGSPIQITTSTGTPVKSGMVSEGSCVELIYNGVTFSLGILGKDYIESSSSNVYLSSKTLLADSWSDVEGEGKYPSKACSVELTTGVTGDFIPEVTFAKSSINEATRCGISYIEYDTANGKLKFFAMKKPQSNLVFGCLLKMFGR